MELPLMHAALATRPSLIQPQDETALSIASFKQDVKSLADHTLASHVVNTLQGLLTATPV